MGVIGRLLICAFLVVMLLCCDSDSEKSEQTEIAHMAKIADRKIAAEKQHKAALQALFQSMLHQLITGQMRVRDLILPGAQEAT